MEKNVQRNSGFILNNNSYQCLSGLFYSPQFQPFFKQEKDHENKTTCKPIITIKPSLAWLIDWHLLETLTSLQKVYDFQLEDARVVPGHGSVIVKKEKQ